MRKPAPEAPTNLNPQQLTRAAACEPEEARLASGALPPTRNPSASACEPYRELIELGVARGRNAMAIWRDLVSRAGYASGYQSVKRFIRRLRGTPAPESHPVIVTAPGQDYGKFRVMLKDASIGVWQAVLSWCLSGWHFP